MRMLPFTSLFLASAALFGAPAEASTRETYRVSANGTQTISMDLCTSVVDVVARGDGDTDLDFTLEDAQGRVVHRDFDDTDVMLATVRPTARGGCSRYKLRVLNLGSVFNDLTVLVDDQGQSIGGSADGEDRRVAVHNHTAEPFRYIYFSRTGDRRWGPDRLGADVQMPRTNRTFDMDDGTGACWFDVKVQTSSGREFTKAGVNVCESSAVEFGSDYSH